MEAFKITSPTETGMKRNCKSTKYIEFCYRNIWLVNQEIFPTLSDCNFQ